MKYYQDEDYADCPNCCFDELYKEFKAKPLPTDEYAWNNSRNPCCISYRKNRNKGCFKAHPIPWQEVIDEDACKESITHAQKTFYKLHRLGKKII